MEAAQPLDMTHNQPMKKIILVQAFKNILPPMENEFIVLLKDSSLSPAITRKMNEEQAIFVRWKPSRKALKDKANALSSLSFRWPKARAAIARLDFLHR